MQIGCFLLVLLLNLAFGNVLMGYFMQSVFGQSLNIFINTALGVIFSEFLIPVDLLLWALSALGGVHFPLVHH